ncbi:MAG: hypothetical protein HRU09_01475 [Oligoflexales bacterium]|nr:hypothetical protein [Oligoflexales bacterium]
MQEFDQNILPLLASPKTADELKVEGSTLIGKTKADAFPFCDGIPWLFINPAQSWAEWGARTSQCFKSIETEITGLTKSIADKKVLSGTKSRLKLIQGGKNEQLKCLKNLLKPLLGSAPIQDVSLANAFWGKFPAQQQLLSYERNIFRDWAWDAEENEKTLELFVKVWEQKKQALGKTLFIGAGSCRFPVDVHRTLNPDLSVACDLNPYLLLTAKKMLAKQALKFYEFPHPALDASNACVKHSLKDSGPEIDNFHLIFCDILKPPFRSGQFDTIVTPWFIDIVQVDFKVLSRLINQLLRPGGQWLNLGPLLFDHCPPGGRYTLEEVKHIAFKSGLKIEGHECADLPYLNSPHSSHRRQERVYVWQAYKDKESPLLEVQSQSHLPSWLLNPEEAIPSLDFFNAFKGTHLTYYETVSLVDGKTSLTDIAKKLSEKHQTPINTMAASVYRFFLSIFEQHKDSMFRGLG